MNSIVILTRYGDNGASSRLRFFQYFSYLMNDGFSISCHSLITNKMLTMLYVSGKYSFFSYITSYFSRFIFLISIDKNKSTLWIEKELFPWAPLWLENIFLRKNNYILDYDDAVFHNYDLHPNKLIRLIYEKKIDGLMARASLVICGNEYLAKRARAAGAVKIQITPTVIDLDKYKFSLKKNTTFIVSKLPVRIVWIGTPSTQKYLELLVEPFQILAKTHNFVFRVIGLDNFEIPGVSVELVTWSEQSEFENIAACDIGVMPLLNTPWEHGKCGYKLIQYMASGLPVVASCVGANSQIVINGVNGYLVDTPSGWIRSLSDLLESKDMRTEMGLAGHQSVEREYNIQKQAPIFANLLKEIVNKHGSRVND